MAACLLCEVVGTVDADWIERTHKTPRLRTGEFNPASHSCDGHQTSVIGPIFCKNDKTFGVLTDRTRSLGTAQLRIGMSTLLSTSSDAVLVPALYNERSHLPATGASTARNSTHVNRLPYAARRNDVRRLRRVSRVIVPSPSDSTKKCPAKIR